MERLLVYISLTIEFSPSSALTANPDDAENGQMGENHKSEGDLESMKGGQIPPKNIDAINCLSSLPGMFYVVLGDGGSSGIRDRDLGM